MLQRSLEKIVGISITYLSKVENEVIPLPRSPLVKLLSKLSIVLIL